MNEPNSQLRRSGVVTHPVPLVGTSNTREVGGFPAVDGRTIASGRLFRGEVLGLSGSRAQSIWNPEHAEHYMALGLRTVIDLRSENEVADVPSAWAMETGATLVHIAFAEGVEGSATDFTRMLREGKITRFEPHDLGAWYQGALDRRADVFGVAVRILADSNNYPVLVHCQVGKDRTGLLIAMVLETLGVPREHVIADYTLTGVLRTGAAERYAEMVQELGLQLDDIRAFWQTPGVAMQLALEHLDERYGSPEDYLKTAGGVSQTEIDALRSILLEEVHPG